MPDKLRWTGPQRIGLFTVESSHTVDGNHQVILRKGGETVAILHGKSHSHLMEDAIRIIQNDTAVPLYSGV